MTAQEYRLLAQHERHLVLAQRKAIPIPQTAAHTRSLEDDFQDFFDIIPMDQVRAIVQDHLANDTELQAVVAFVKSEDFKETLLALEEIPEYIAFLNYMYESGLDVYYYINWVHDLIGIPQLTPPFDATRSTQSRSLATMVDDIIAILPEEELEALCQEKLQTSPEFKEMYDRMRSPEFMQIVMNLLAVPEYRELKQHLLDNGVDVDQLLRLFHAMIGLPSGSDKMEGLIDSAPAAKVITRDERTLEDDFQDFFDLIPMDQVRAIVQDHLANDTELQAVVAFVKSEDFKETLLALEEIPEYIDFLDYMYDSGLDVYYYINWVHNLIGIPELTPPSDTKQCRSLSSMVDDIIAILPEKELEALCQEKLQTSPEFKEMYDRMRAPEFMQIVLNLLAVPEYRELKLHLLDNGVDVDELLRLFHAMIGLPSRTLSSGAAVGGNSMKDIQQQELPSVCTPNDIKIQLSVQRAVSKWDPILGNMYQ
ncbi:uncharacterized protein LOC126335954 [Schistocerca gregaria]|uniref:uncharacterized protein LOC126335954 n=1 Tax=Schistocerca gregaria TaxID=7010 RepID=UPI00211ED216|nr:uncharacterized protein LOC126335954 [Schistocerca gregaria]